MTWLPRMALLLLAAGCMKQRSTAPAPCLADDLGAISLPVAKRDGCGPADLTCRDACLQGDAASCYARAIALERDPASAGEAELLYHRGCTLGLAIACTNYAANLWGSQHAPALAQRCALRLFEKTCDAREKFGCGMLGRLLVEDEHQIDRGRDVLERACAELQGFPCRALALEIEAGRLGPDQPLRIPTLLRRACEGGDPDGCGQHATVSETFGLAR